MTGRPRRSGTSSSEFCYDFLRDNLAWDPDGISQRGLGVAIVDEADLILIDDMRTPTMAERPGRRARGPA